MLVCNVLLDTPHFITISWIRFRIADVYLIRWRCIKLSNLEVGIKSSDFEAHSSGRKLTFRMFYFTIFKKKRVKRLLLQSENKTKYGTWTKFITEWTDKSFTIFTHVKLIELLSCLATFAVAAFGWTNGWLAGKID